MTVQFDSDVLTVYLNRGDGTFPDGGSAVFSVGGGDVNQVVAADFNGDGNVDVATQGCGSGGPAIDVHFGNGDGTFVENRGYDLDFPDPPFPSSCTDALGVITLANDRLPSLMVSTQDQQITIRRNDGTGLLLQQQSVFGASGTRLSGASAGDFNGDRLQDIAAVSTDPDGHTRHVVIFYQQPDGTFTAPATIFTLDSQLQFMQTVDLNGDQQPDFAGIDNSGKLLVFLNTTRRK